MAGLQKILKINNINIDDYDLFIETGLYDGTNIASMYTNGLLKNVDIAYSIELNEKFIDNAYLKFPFLKNSNINLLHGDSGLLLEDIFKKNNSKKILVWLDAHYSAGDTAKSGKFGECPIIAEIESLKHLKIKPTIIIDDVGCFMSEKPYYYDGWPKIENIISIAKKYFDFDIFFSERDEKNLLHYAILK